MNGDDLINELIKKFKVKNQKELAAILGKQNAQLSAMRNQKISAVTVANMMAGLNQQIVRGDELLPAVKKKFKLRTTKDIAMILGMSVPAMDKWKPQKKGITTRQIVSAISTSKNAAKSDAHSELLRPIVEFFPLDGIESQGGMHYELFAIKKNATKQQKELRELLQKTKGIYIFYDTRGKAVYAGKAKKQTLWVELKSAFNRHRKTQAVFRVDHPERNQSFQPAYKKERQPIKRPVNLSEIAAYLSVYEVDEPMINSMEALLVRGFANDLLNTRMEKFSIKKPVKKGKAKRKKRS